MTDLLTLYRDDPNLHYITNFTEFDTMEDKKGVNNTKSLEDWKKELQKNVLTSSEAIKINGGRTLKEDKWNSGCGGIVPQ